MFSVFMKMQNQYSAEFIQRIDPFYNIFNVYTRLFLGTIYFGTGRKNPLLILNNYEYRVQRKMETTTFWVCTFCGRTRCKARLITKAKVVIMSFNEHNHEPKLVDVTGLISSNVTIIRKRSPY